ncbi:hypothetical protein TREMEDRAFT_63882 [Tremella mesenterica DSM 1558]|uniref:uncharacterized protein n=1 Tax=Tremella mesenterica (strain ATCC 24925 / CBS 8224 / DSM 1558 / NBRC 9311 / NRRL Y-6157 / RJB 2259-6 / UBC 559-6) TaxID=578456 RepID=UPI0003F48E9F|nr:uncharacterized protein TREMEDRAFT_63882 [Tremella mesenterica DSM 1558]EIW67998.1 hypothetical protein TREMEDRAFT_63882 [Tremella mesenterica DSM 1558]
MPRINSEPTHAKDVKPYTLPPKKNTTSSSLVHSDLTEIGRQGVKKEDSSLVVKEESQAQKNGRGKMEKVGRKAGKEIRKEGNPRAAKVWTGQEKIKLFEVIMKNGLSTKGLEGHFEDRTGKQCYDTWQNTMVPAIKRFLAEGAKKT